MIHRQAEIDQAKGIVDENRGEPFRRQKQRHALMFEFPTGMMGVPALALVSIFTRLPPDTRIDRWIDAGYDDCITFRAWSSEFPPHDEGSQYPKAKVTFECSPDGEHRDAAIEW